MVSGVARRDLLRTVGTALAGAVAGCGGAGPAGSSVSVTPAPVPTTATTDRVTHTGTEAGLRPRHLMFDVDMVAPFRPNSPARLEISVRNRSDRRVVAIAGSRFVLPFVDPDYAGTDRTGEPTLVLVPDSTRRIVDPVDGPPGRLTALLPEAPVDGCWRLPFDWPPAWAARDAQLQAVSLPPGEARRHLYRLYFVDDCTTGAFTFEHTFDLAVGRPRRDGDLYRVQLGFVLTVTDNRGVIVEAHQPVIRRPGRGIGRK